MNKKPKEGDCGHTTLREIFNISDEYEPYGKEWERELLKFTKMELIEMIRRIKQDDNPDFRGAKTK